MKSKSNGSRRIRSSNKANEKNTKKYKIFTNSHHVVETVKFFETKFIND